LREPCSWGEEEETNIGETKERERLQRNKPEDGGRESSKNNC
jgi:hypothetical protein